MRLARGGLLIACVGSLMGATCASAGDKSLRVNARWCAHQYDLAVEGVPVCSTLRLDEDQLARLNQQYREVRELYGEFAAARGLTFDERKLRPPALHVVRYTQINDRAAFPRKDSVGNILGRYIMGRGWVFVTERALGEEGVTHLAHELAHWIQDMHGLKDKQRDEELAQEFHRFYEKQHKEKAGQHKEKAGEKLSCLREGVAASCARAGSEA